MKEHTSKPYKNTPPIFKTWRGIYLFILILHAVVIGLFFLFTQIFNTT